MTRLITCTHACTTAQRGKRVSAPPDEMPILRGKAGGASLGPDIPDFLRLQPDAEALKYEAMKKDLTAKLAPSAATLEEVMKHPELMTMFDDPEVMKAVDEIGKDPSKAATKYRDNKRVQAFYGAFGQMMGEKLEAIGNGQAGAAAGAPQGGASRSGGTNQRSITSA